MRRRRAPQIQPDESSSDDEPLSKIAKPKKPPNDDSSSESDIENYLQPADKLDLNSSFFNPQKDEPPAFDKIESDILAGVVTTLTDSESDDETVAPEVVQNSSGSKLNFGQLHEYTRKMEEARKHVEEYNARKKAKESEVDVGNLLAAGEGVSGEKRASLGGSLHSSDFESCSDSEKEGWEEVEEKQKEQSEIPKEGLQITVEMPNTVRKKKGVDLLAAIKRRINRVRKENQVLIHKVHLLCWIAYGNHVSAAINSENVLAMALSLLPSQHSYPPERADLKYLEQLLKWYCKTIVIDEKVRVTDTDKSLSEILEEQMVEKVAYDRRVFVFIFVAIVRSLGIQCRVVLSLQVEPLRPPSSELHSLSTKVDAKTKDASEKDQSRGKSSEGASKMVEAKKPRAKSTSEVSKIEKKKSGENEIENEAEKEKKKPRAKSTGGGEKKMSGGKNVGKKSETKEVKVEITRMKVNNEGAEGGSKVKDKVENEKKCRAKVSNEGEEKKSRGGEDKEKMKVTGLKVNDEDIKKGKTRERSKSEGKGGTKNIQKGESRANGVDEGRSGSKLGGGGVKKENCRTKGQGEANDVETKKRRVKSTDETKTKGSKIKSGGDRKVDTIKGEIKGGETTVINLRKLRTRKNLAVPQLDGASDNPGPSKPNLKKLNKKQPPCPVSDHPKRLKAAVKYRDSDSEDDFTSTRTPFSPKTNSPQTNGAPNLKKLKNHKSVDVRADIVNLVKKSIKHQKDVDRSKTVRKHKTAPDGDDSDYAPEAVKKKRRESEDDFSPKVKVKRRVQVKPETEDEKLRKKQGVDVWAEVFLENEEKWISVDVFKAQVHCVNELHARASHPVSYVVAWNNDNTLKDITKRYCTNFNTVTRKLRIDAKWWEDTLKSFTGRKNVRDKEEDEELERQQLEKPLPTSITEYKNHPLYVLKRHLLKFEGIYPPDAPTLGFVRKEAVYSRQCVYTLHSRDIWLKHAKVVKPGEQPYKIVKARPRWDKLSNTVITDQLLEIFGPWQTEDYVPPTAENGVVPRNAFGNVELFKPCMLPKKTVHMKLPGLNKVARKLNIDCASAIVGFDFHAGWSHPTYDGFVVCEEFADVLAAAWEQEQEEIEKKEQEKIDKRVYGNWKKLIRGLLIRERLKKKYEFGETSGQGKKKKKAAAKIGSDSD